MDPAQKDSFSVDASKPMVNSALFSKMWYPMKSNLCLGLCYDLLMFTMKLKILD